jgi:hypothetical protein
MQSTIEEKAFLVQLKSFFTVTDTTYGERRSLRDRAKSSRSSTGQCGSAENFT